MKRALRLRIGNQVQQLPHQRPDSKIKRRINTSRLVRRWLNSVFGTKGTERRMYRDDA